MRKILKAIGKLLLALLSVVFILLSATTIYHHVSLGREASQIVPNGQLVTVDDRQIHVYAEGEKGEQPTLVFLSGSATVSPVYDFKSLYSRLSDQYRIVVVEKTGYGYSEIRDVPRDIDTMLDEVRQGLALAGESGPYVLFPHSMSGLEAVYWAQRYPEEVAAIVGLDMAVPESYEHFDFSSVNQLMYVGRASVWLGLHRIPGVYALDATALTEQEIEQQTLLMHRNAVNIDFVLEGKAAAGNARAVKSGGPVGQPILMFVSDGEDIGEYWLPCQNDFAVQNGARLVRLDCGHYVHHFEAGAIADESLAFLATLP